MRTILLGVMVAGAAAVRAAEEPPKGWEHTLSLGINVTDGNTEVQRYNASWLSTFRSDVDELRALADYNYGKSSGERDLDNARAEAGYRRNADKVWFLLANAGYNYDQVADVDYRWILSPGVGARLLNRSAVRLSLEAGPAWISEKVGGVEDEYWSLRAAERLELTLEGGAKIWQTVEYLPAFDDLGDALVNAELGVEAALTQRLSLRLVARNIYDRTPAEGRQKNDLSIIGGLALKL